jgi:hypothetical protein
MDDEMLREQAVRQLRRKRDFWGHVVAYVVVNAFLIAIWFFVAGRGYFWPGWVLLGWGIGLALNAWEVYGRRGISEADIRQEMDRQRTSGRIYDDKDKDKDKDKD